MNLPALKGDYLGCVMNPDGRFDLYGNYYTVGFTTMIIKFYIDSTALKGGVLNPTANNRSYR
jgi:hypothetical protein